MVGAERTHPKDRPEEKLEYTLSSSLDQVDPNPEFVNRLKNRFERPSSTVIEARTFWWIYLIVASGLLMGICLLWLIQRLARPRRK